jgi:rod shape-determining protein MreC
VPVGQSVIFPENINIGTIEKYTLTIKPLLHFNIKLFNDMTNLGHVYVSKSKK